MTSLLRHPAGGSAPKLHAIEPASAGWRWTSLDVHLNVVAGPNRARHVTIDPDHQWLMDRSPR